MRVRRAALVLALGMLLGALLPGSGARPARAQIGDEAYLQTVLDRVLETEQTGVEIPWSNEDTGSRGTITVERTFYLDPNSPCRDYRRTEEQPGGARLVIRGTGCRVGANDWTIDERAPVRESDTAAPAEPEPDEAAPAGPLCPPVAVPGVVRVPCTKPIPFTEYTMPSKAAL